MHGVSGLETRRVAGVQGTVAVGESSGVSQSIRGVTDLLRLTRPSVASGSERRVKTLWEVAADAGSSTVVVNWWATWPASSSSEGAIIISDRAVLRLDLGGALDAESRRRQSTKDSRSRVVIGSRATATARTASAALELGLAQTRARSIAELDAIQLELMCAVQTSPPIPPPCICRGSISHRTPLLGAREDPLWRRPEVTARVQALRDYVVFLDRLLAAVITLANSELVVLLTNRVGVAADIGCRAIRNWWINCGAARGRSWTRD